MKNALILLAVVFATSCSSGDKEVDPSLKVSSDTSEKIKEAQDVNIELEEIDGELDSLIVTIK